MWFLPVSHQAGAAEQNSSKLLEPDDLKISTQFRDILPKENKLISLAQQKLRSSHEEHFLQESGCELPVSSQTAVIAALCSGGGGGTRASVDTSLATNGGISERGKKILSIVVFD